MAAPTINYSELQSTKDSNSCDNSKPLIGDALQEEEGMYLHIREAIFKKKIYEN